MKTKFLFAMAAAAMVLTACSNNETEAADTPVPVAFSGSVGGSVTATPVSRAIDQTWSKNDAIGIFMIAAGQTFSPANVRADNIRYVVDNATAGTFKPGSNTIYYPMDDSEVDFYAYYPQGTVSRKEESTNYLYAIDVASQTNQEALDFMYSANVKGKKKSDKTAAALEFTHQLCKVVLTVEPGNGVSLDDLSRLTVKVNGQKTTTTFDLTAGALKDNAANSADITLFKQADAYIYEAVLLPNTSTQRVFEFALNNAHDVPFTWDMNKALTAGSKYTYTVKLNRTGVTVTGQIGAWSPETGGEVDAN